MKVISRDYFTMESGIIVGEEDGAEGCHRDHVAKRFTSCHRQSRGEHVVAVLGRADIEVASFRREEEY
ncbi:glucans biosynthesis glucosyltransferase MdoH [Sesbania bispinosa]|nr:glucans biosynthesis glucosyltransferase MdoH [Sesbania bispinosa]